MLISAVAHNSPNAVYAAQNAPTVNTRSSVAPCICCCYLSVFFQLCTLLLFLFSDPYCYDLSDWGWGLLVYH